MDGCMDLISIIVPVYNVQNELRRCIDSLISQTYRELEIILVDDGSTDASGEIADEYQKMDHRISVIHKQNGGLSDARNCGIDSCKGEYLYFVDSDDYICSETIELLYRNLKENEADMAIASAIIGSEAQYKWEQLENNAVVCSGEKILELQDRDNSLDLSVAWNKLYKRHLFETVRYPLGKRNEDEFVTYKIFYLSTKCVYVHAKTYYYFQREDSIMNQPFSIKNLDIIEAYEEKVTFWEGKNSILFDKSVAALFLAMKNGILQTKMYSYRKELDELLRKYLYYKREYINKTNLPIYKKIKYYGFYFIWPVVSFLQRDL